jgi:protein-disulfide isomerase
MSASATLTPPASERDHSQGPAGARLTLVEYGDYQCPFCGAAYPVVKRLQGSFDWELRFIFRNFPLTEAHPFAMVAAEAAEAAALQGKFWEMHDLLFENQAQLEPAAILVWAREVGLDLEKFGTAIRQGEITRRIKEDRRSGIASGVNGTPCFFVNGARFDGPASYEALRAALKK